tara:strand:+ start:3891 stop:4553 length:663 start_codon:yes stop_codon:yes gene_type:complete
MSGVTVHTAESTDVISSNEVKTQLRIATSDSTHDTLIGVCRDAAIAIAKEVLNRSLIQRTLILNLDYINNDQDGLPDREGITVGPYLSYKKRQVYLPFSPLVSVTHVKTYNDSDEATTMATSTYYVDTSSEIGRVVLRTGETWPDMLRVANALEIKYVAGYGSAVATVPTSIRQGCIILAAHLFENPDMVIKGESAAVIPSLVNACWNPYKVRRFGIGFG